MRITVGGLLLTVGVGTGAALGPLHSPEKGLTGHLTGYIEQAKTFMGLAPAPIEKPIEAVAVSASGGSPLSSETKPLSAPAQGSTVVATATVNAPVAPLKAEEPVKRAPVVIARPVAPVPTPAPSHFRRGVRHHFSVPVAAVKAVPTGRAIPAAKTLPERTPRVQSATPAESKISASKEIPVGTYVTVKLKTGVEVKGIFQQRTAQGVRIELPGTGPFDYPAANVVNVTPTQ